MPATRYAPTTYGSSEVGGAGGTRTGRRADRRSRRGRDPKWARLLVMFGALLMMLSGVSIVGEKVLISQVSDNLNQIEALSQHRVSIKGAVNVLLVGVDTRADDGTRADSIIIMHIPATHDRAYLVSLPRDALVNIPPYPKTGFNGARRTKINAAFSFGMQGRNGSLANGFALLARTITSFTGIPIHAGAIVNFDGFRALVGTLGGVKMCVDEKVTSIHIGIDSRGRVVPPYTNRADKPIAVPGVKPVVYQPGCRQMAPWQALDYVRQRDLLANGDGDYGRQRHQQQFIRAVFQAALTKGLTNPTKINSIIRAVGKAVTTDLGGVSVETWINSMGGIRDIEMIKTNLNAAGQQYNSVMENGEYQGEALSADTMTLLRSIATDDVQTFVTQHPAWVTRN